MQELGEEDEVYKNGNWRDDLKAEAKQKNKKKNNKKNKNKEDGDGEWATVTHRENTNGVRCNDDGLDKTQSTVGFQEGSANNYRSKTFKEDNNAQEPDFTPLKDKLGSSFFED